MNMFDLLEKLEKDGKSLLDIRFPLNNPHAIEELKEVNLRESMDGNFLNFLINNFEIFKAKPFTAYEYCNYCISNINAIKQCVENKVPTSDDVWTFLMGIHDAMRFFNIPYYYRVGVGQIIDKYGTWEDNETDYPIETTDCTNLFPIPDKKS